MTIAIVPMKDLGQAKQRLAPILSDAERMGLVYAMLRDVVRALGNARHIARSYIVAHDRGYLDFDLDLIEEPLNTGYNEAVALAVAAPQLSRADAALVVPGDIPLVGPDDIDALAAPMIGPGVRLSAARDGDGTNGFAMTPPGLMQTAFGPGSFDRHQKLAHALGAAIEVVRRDRLAFDIDTPDDLRALCSVDGTGETHTFLDRSGLRRRLLAARS